MQNFCFPTFLFVIRHAAVPCSCKQYIIEKTYYARAKVFLKLKVENGKLKIAVGQTVCKRKNTTYAVKNTA